MAQRFEGHNLDEALDNAARTFGVERYQLAHSVILEKRGFLGGVKRIVIEAGVNEDAQPPAPAPAPAPEFALPARRPRREGGGRSSRPPRHRERRERRQDDLRPGDFERYAAVDVPEQGLESDEAKAVREWCEEVIDLGRFDLDVRTEENDEQIIVRLYGRDTRRLIDEHGEALDALQVLANKALIGRKTEKDIELDCEGFKSRRRDEIEQQARDAADRVRRDRREQLLPAMTPIERRIVHLTLQDDAEVTTESRGDGFYKRVAIKLRAETEASS